MATRVQKTRTTVLLREPPSSPPPMDAETIPADLREDRPSPVIAGEQDSLMDLMNSFTDALTVTVKVYRVQKNKPLAYVFECSPETFSLDSLRDDYGGGEFRVYIHQNSELIKNVRVVIEPPRPAHRAAPEASELDKLMAAINARQDRTDKVLELLAAKVAAPAPSLGSMLGGLDLPATITAVGAVLNMLRPPPAPVLPPPPPPPPADSGIDLLLKGIELARQLREDSGGNGETSFMDLARDMLKSPILASAVSAAAQQQAAPQMTPQPAPRPALPPGAAVARTPMGAVVQQQRPPQPVPAPDPAPQPAAVEPQQAPQTDDAQLAPYMAQLCALAAQDADPDLYAGLILDQLDDEALITMLGWEPSTLERMIQIHPAVANHREWFTKLIEAVASAFDESEAEEGAADGGGAGTADSVESGNAS